MFKFIIFSLLLIISLYFQSWIWFGCTLTLIVMKSLFGKA